MDLQKNAGGHPARFLVLRGGAIGDLVLTLPVLQALREQWPDSRIELVGYPRTNALVEAAGLADKTHSLDGAGISRLYVPDADVPLEMARWLGGFSLAIHFLSDPEGIVSGNLAAVLPQVISRTPMPPAGMHASDHYLSVLEELALFESGRAPRIITVAETRPPARVAIHPGSGGAHKNWPLERYLELAASLDHPVWVLGEADDALRRALPAGAERLDCLPLPQLARVLAGCRLFIGNDSGITHLAAAVGTPVVALFGPTDPGQWAPRGPRVSILRSPTGFIGHVDPSGVSDAVAAALAATEVSS